MYRIVRFFFKHPAGTVRRAIKSGLTLEEAQAHCRNPETSSSTCTTAERIRYTERVGPWFDGYEET